MPLAILMDKPCAIAVFPTPGSPIKHGLFLLRRFKIWIILWISLSLPITISNWPFFAFWVRLVPNVSKAFLRLSFFTFTFFFSVVEVVSACSSSLEEPPNIPEKIEPKGIALKWIGVLSLVFSASSSGSISSICLDSASISIFCAKSATIFSICFDISFKSFSERFACFIKDSIGLIPCFFAQS